MQAGELTIDLVHRRVIRAGLEVKLSPKEWDILEQLAIHAGRVVTHGQILAKVWGRATETERQFCGLCASSVKSWSASPTGRAGW